MILKCNLKIILGKSTSVRPWMFPRLCENALAVTIPFATTYLCESEFSTPLSVKTKSGNRLNAQADMRTDLSNSSTFEKRKQETGTEPLNWNPIITP